MTQYMTVTVALTGNATAAVRFIAAVSPNALNAEGRGHPNARLALSPYNLIWCCEVSTVCKSPLILAVQLARISSSTGNLHIQMSLWLTPQISVFLLCLLGLSLLGWLPGVLLWVRGFCQHNQQNTTAANMRLPYIFLSSNRISTFSPKLIKNTPTQLPVGPWRLLPYLSTAAKSKSKFQCSASVVFLPFPTSGWTTCILLTRNMPLLSYPLGQ